MMRALIVNPWAQTITESDKPDWTFRDILAAMRSNSMKVPGDLLDSLRMYNGTDRLWVDDNGYATRGLRVFHLKGYPNPLCGSAVLLGTDAAGYSCDPKIGKAELEGMVIWTGLDTSGEVGPQTTKDGQWRGQAAKIIVPGGPVLIPAEDALNNSEAFLLRWLATGPGLLGECDGASLDRLVKDGLAERSATHVKITPVGQARMKAEGWKPYDGTN